MPKKCKNKVTLTTDQLNTIRHDLKNFLNIIGGNAQLLTLINTDVHTKKHCTEMIDNIDQCVEYIDKNIR